jgi:hypothetical protein
VAIKEFIIEPQNYFEPGYFDGDYTEPNITRARLICDADRTVGFQFLAGFYFEEGFIEDGAFGVNSVISTLTADAMIVQEATVGLQGYYSEGYYATGYYESRGSQFSLTAELEIVGEDVFATGNFASEATMAITVSKTVSAESIMTVEFVQVAFGARERDIDLFAFSDAAIAVVISVTRTTNIELSSVFDIATDGRRFRDITAAEDALFDFNAIVERSREFNIETQAAFSFDVVGTRIRFNNSNLTSATTLSAIISHIEGTDIVVNGFASLSAELTIVTKETAVALQSTASINVIIGIRKQFNSSINVYSSILVSRRVGQIRPRNLNVGTINATNFFDSTIKRFGTHSYRPKQGSLTFSSGNTFINPIKISAGQSFIAEGWVYYDNTNSAYFSFNIGPVGILLGPGIATQGSVLNSVGGTTFSFSDVNFQAGRNSWQYWAIVSDGSRISWYLNSIRVGTTTTLPTNYYVRSLDIFSNAGGAWTDELSFHKNTTLGFNPNNTTITIPTSARTNDLSTTEALWHFDGNGLDDFPSDTNQAGLAELISTCAINAKLSGIEKFSANLQSNSSLACTISHIEGADLTAFSNAALTTEILRIKQLAASVQSEFTVSCQDSKITDVESNQSCSSAVTADASVIRDAQITTEALATQLTAVVRLAGLFADDLVIATLSADAVVTRSAESLLLSSAALVADNFRVRFNSIDAASEFTTVVQGFVGKIADSNMSALFAQTTDANRFRDNTATLNAVSELTATVNNLGKIESSLFNAATVIIEAVKITSTNTNANIIATLAASTDISLTKDYQIAMSAEFTDSFNVEKRVGTSAFLTAFASKLTVAVKQTVTDLDVEVMSTLSASAVKTTDIEADVTSTSSQTALATKTASAESAQSSEFTQTADGIKAVFGSADLTAFAFKLAAAVKTAGISISTNTSATMTVSAVKTASINSSLDSTATVAVSIQRIRSAESALISNFTQISNVGFLASAQISIASAMSFVSEVREIHVEEIVYVIPGEIGEYEITSETRLHTIGSESREYIIT